MGPIKKIRVARAKRAIKTLVEQAEFFDKQNLLEAKAAAETFRDERLHKFMLELAEHTPILALTKKSRSKITATAMEISVKTQEIVLEHEERLRRTGQFRSRADAIQEFINALSGHKSPSNGEKYVN